MTSCEFWSPGLMRFRSFYLHLLGKVTMVISRSSFLPPVEGPCRKEPRLLNRQPAAQGHVSEDTFNLPGQQLPQLKTGTWVSPGAIKEWNNSLNNRIWKNNKLGLIQNVWDSRWSISSNLRFENMNWYSELFCYNFL